MSVGSKIEPSLQKWTGFVGKVSARLQEILAEADAGLTELIAQQPTDHGPLGAAFSAVQARFHALTPKVDEAYEKTTEAIDEIVDAEEPTEEEQRWVWDTLATLENQRSEITERIDLAYEELQMRKNAEWAQRLKALAEQEWAQGVACSQCGQPFRPDVYWRASQAACTSCGAVNDVHPGMACGLYFQGVGVHALSVAGAWSEWLVERSAERAFKAWRHPTAADRAVWIEAARAYYGRYYQVGMSLHPELCAGLEQAVEAKLAHYAQWDQVIDQQRRDFMGRLVDAARRADIAGLRALASGPRPADTDLSECVEALVERRFEEPAWALLDLQYEHDGEDGDRREWIAEQLADVRRTVLR